MKQTTNKTKYICKKVSSSSKLQQKTKIINKGTGAGGANTNTNGKLFEKKTDFQRKLLKDGFKKIYFSSFPSTTPFSKSVYNYCLLKSDTKKTIVFVLQNGLKTYLKYKYNIDLFRFPDEAFIFEYKSGKKVLKILEKKKQNVDGSMETKLWSGPSLKREYEIVLGNNFIVDYSFCVSDFLKQKIISSENKYIILNSILKEHNISVLFGDDKNYFQTFQKWLKRSL